MVMAIAGTAIAQDLGNSRERPVKNTPTVTYIPPAEAQQGGDTILDAVMITIPASENGTTAGYNDDYDEVCPYSGSTSPDVVYPFIAGSNIGIDVDLFGSTYDTKVYMYDESLALVACNDDFYPDFVSKLENVPVLTGVQYFIVIDGYGGAFGNYELTVDEVVPPPPCFVICDPDALLEGEPTLADGYQDAHNGGCNSPDFGNPFQPIDWANDEDGVPPYEGDTAWLCGVSGWYVSAEGGLSRDTDWFIAIMGASGEMEFTVESEYPCFIFELGPQDCGTVGVVQQATADCNAPATLTITGYTPGDPVWLWVGPTECSGPVTEFPYFATLTGHEFNLPVPSEDISWGGVKALYR